MKFNEQKYLDEIQALIANAKNRMMEKHPDVVIYTINIWTDPGAAVSAVNFDTFENSVAKVKSANAFSKKYYDEYMAKGDEEMAKLFFPIPPEGRNSNPADFAFRVFVEIEHKAFSPLWEEKSKGKCWDILEPALLKVGEMAKTSFADLPLHPKVELSVNSRRDWYDTTWPISK